MSPTESQDGRHFASLNVPAARPVLQEVSPENAVDLFDQLIQSADTLDLAPAAEDDCNR